MMIKSTTPAMRRGERGDAIRRVTRLLLTVGRPTSSDVAGLLLIDKMDYAALVKVLEMAEKNLERKISGRSKPDAAAGDKVEK